MTRLSSFFLRKFRQAILFTVLFTGLFWAGRGALAENLPTSDFRPILRIGFIEASFMPSERQAVDETFSWLKRILPQYRIEIISYPVRELENAIRHEQIDFFLGASGFYRRVFFRGLRDLATMTTRLAPDPGEGSGTAFLVLKDSPAKTLADLRGKRAATSWAEGFTGVFIPMGEVRSAGFDPDRFFRFVIAGSPMTRLLESVERGDAEVAMARACSLEVLEVENPALAAKFRVINEKKNTHGFHCRRSTALYPNWTFVSTKSASWQASRDITAALLAMPATRDGTAWGVVSDFASVDNLYRDLQAGPYGYLRVETLSGFVQKYRIPIGILLLVLVGLALHSWRSECLVARRTLELREAMQKERESEQRVQKAEEQLRTLERVSVVGAMSSLIAHELNGPISVISNSCGALERWMERNDCPDLLERTVRLIERQCARSANIIERVRQYAGSRDRALKPVSVTAVASRVMALRRNAHPDVSMSLDLPDEALLVEWDELECELVINNLLKNAAEACRGFNNATLCLRAERADDFVCITVEDNAPTEDEELVRHIEPLHSGKTGGTGLGLLIVRTLVERISGHFSILRVNDRTVATLRLPTGFGSATAQSQLSEASKEQS